MSHLEIDRRSHAQAAIIHIPTIDHRLFVENDKEQAKSAQLVPCPQAIGERGSMQGRRDHRNAVDEVRQRRGEAQTSNVEVHRNLSDRAVTDMGRGDRAGQSVTVGIHLTTTKADHGFGAMVRGLHGPRA